MAFQFPTLTLWRSGAALLAAPALMALISSCTADVRTRQDQITAQNETVVRDAFDDWAAGQGGVFDLLSPDVVWTIHGSGPVAGTYSGSEDFSRRASAPLISRLSTPLVPDVHDIWAVGDAVIIRFDASATTTAGDPYRNQFVWIFRMKDGLVVEAEAFLDLVAYQHVIENNPPHEN